MRKIIIVVMTLLPMFESLAQLKYPTTRKADVTDVYHGTSVSDPYRWLEDDNSEETKAWVKHQNDLTFGYLSKIPFRNGVRERLEAMWNIPKYSSPSKEGDYY